MISVVLLIIGIILYGISTIFRFKMSNICMKKTGHTPWGIAIPFTYLMILRDYELDNSCLRPFIYFWLIFSIGSLLLLTSLLIEIL